MTEQKFLTVYVNVVAWELLLKDQILKLHSPSG